MSFGPLGLQRVPLLEGVLDQPGRPDARQKLALEAQAREDLAAGEEEVLDRRPLAQTRQPQKLFRFEGIERVWQDLKDWLAYVLMAQIEELEHQIATLRPPWPPGKSAMR